MSASPSVSPRKIGACHNENRSGDNTAHQEEKEMQRGRGRRCSAGEEGRSAREITGCNAEDMTQRAGDNRTQRGEQDAARRTGRSAEDRTQRGGHNAARRTGRSAEDTTQRAGDNRTRSKTDYHHRKATTIQRRSDDHRGGQVKRLAESAGRVETHEPGSTHGCACGRYRDEMGRDADCSALMQQGLMSPACRTCMRNPR